MTAVVAAFIAADSVLGERWAGTWHWLAALPVARRTVLIVKAGVGVAILGATVAASAAIVGGVVLLREGAPFHRIDAWYGLAVRDPFALAAAGAGLTTLAVAVWAATFLASAHEWRVPGRAGAGGALGPIRALLVGRGIVGKELAEVLHVVLLALPIVVIIPAVAYAAAAWIGVTRVARERERRTLDALNALPLEPRAVLGRKFFGGGIAVGAVAAAGMPRTLLSGDATAVAAQALFPLALYAMAFLCSLALPTTGRAAAALVAVLVVLGVGLRVNARVLVAGIAFFLVYAVPIWSGVEDHVWFPEVGTLKVPPAPWRRMAFPAAGLLLAAGYVWWTWYDFLAAPTAIVRPAALVPEAVGFDVAPHPDGIAIRRPDGGLEIRDAADPRRVVAARPLAAGEWEESFARPRGAGPGLVSMDGGLPVVLTDPMLRDAWQDPDQGVVDGPTTGFSHRSGITVEAAASPGAYIDGPPGAALVVRPIRSWWNADRPRSSWAGDAYAAMPWPAEIAETAHAAVRAVALGSDRQRTYLIGDAGLVVVGLEGIGIP